MAQKKIPKRFWRENPLAEMSFAQLALFSMTTCFDADVSEELFRIAKEGISPQRLEKIDTERELIAQLDSGDAVVSFLRREYDVTNRALLCRKALELEEAVMPLLLRRYRTSVQTTFIEGAGMILGNCQARHVQELKAMYRDIRSPYAQAVACVAFAAQEEQEVVGDMLEEYQRMLREYPEENYCQGPLLALHVLCDR